MHHNTLKIYCAVAMQYKVTGCNCPGPEPMKSWPNYSRNRNCPEAKVISWNCPRVRTNVRIYCPSGASIR